MVYRFGECTLDTQRHRLQRAGKPVRLRSKAFQVLCYLLAHRDRMIPKSELYAQVWPQSFISEATLESTLRAVRQAIGDNGRAQQLIQTVYGYGYRVVAPVEELADLPAEVEGKAPGMEPEAVAVYLEGASEVVLPPHGPGPAVEPDGREGEGGRDQERTLPPGDLLQPGEWKLVTILCTAPVPRSAGGAQPDADTGYRQLSRLYTLAQPVVQRYEATLQPVLGDHVLAVFGVPVAQEDHAERAVLAALELQRRVREAGMDGRAQPGDALELRVGLDTGQVAVGGIGDATAGLAVVGETVMRVLALQVQAAPGTILCSEATAQLVQKAVRIEAVPPVPIAGEPTPVAAYTVLGPYRRRPFRTLARRVWAPFVGRHHELETLRALVPPVEESRGQVVGVIGEPGVGKSRLCYEFLCDSLAHPWVILETQGTAYGQGTPYLPIIDLLKDYFRIEDRDDLPTIRDKVTAQLRRLDDALTPTAPAFLTLLDVPADDPPWQALDPRQRRQRTLDALKRLLLRESQVQPLLLVVENLHWSDAETQAVLDTLVESLPAARLFLLTTYRPEYRHAWGSKTFYTQLRVDPLPRERARELVEALLGDDAALEPLKQRLVERTQGNPFFLEESIRSLVETQVLVGVQGAYRLAQDLPSLQVPATVQAVLAARIDQLAAEEKRLLQTAAVIGHEVPMPLLQALAELPADVLHRGLDHLQAAEFLYETRLFPEREFTFKHALTHEVGYGSLPHERRRVLHARILEALEQTTTERLAEQVERLALHALRGEVWDKAIAYGQQAGGRARDRAAFRAAATCYEEALDALGHLPETPDTGRLAIELRLGLAGSALHPLGEYGRELAVLREAEALARTHDDRAWLVRVLARLANVFRRVGDYAGALAAGQQALALATERGDLALQAAASFTLGGLYEAIGDYGRAAELFRRNVEARFSGTGRQDGQIHALAWLARALSELGQFTEGRRHGEEALRLATVEGRGTEPMFAHLILGRLYLAQGDPVAAIRLLDQSLTLCRAAELWNLRAGITGDLGYAYALVGRLAEGRALLEEALRENLRMGTLHNQSLHVARLSAVCLLDGRVDEAGQHARQALDLARQHGERGREALALCQLGAVHAQADLPEVAQSEARYREALALAEALGMRPLQAHCHRGLGMLYAKTGRPEQARAELTTASELYHAMEMTFWLPQTEAALAKAI